MPMEMILLVCLAGFFIFAFGYILGQTNERNKIRQQLLERHLVEIEDAEDSEFKWLVGTHVEHMKH